MKKGIFFSLTVILLLSLALALPIVGSAKATKIPICALQIDDSESGGKVWFTEEGTIMHIRGLTKVAHIVPLPGHPECESMYSVGSLVMKTNIDLNLVTGEGKAWGKGTISPDAFDGTWQITFKGQIQNYAFTARSTSHGTGALEGLLQKNTITEIGPGEYEVFGYVLTH
jgi:hypothetical protein